MYPIVGKIDKKEDLENLFWNEENGRQADYLPSRGIDPGLNRPPEFR